MKLYKRFKSHMIWIVFVMISFSSSAYLLNEYSRLEHPVSGSITVKEAIESEEAGNEENFKSNDLMILKNLSELISKFLNS